MLRVNGFYGHIKQHDMRSVGMFLGFMVAFQIVTAVVLTIPMFFIDIQNVPVLNPVAYFKEWGIPVFIVGFIFFLYRYAAHLKDLQQSLGFQTVSKLEQPRLFRIVEPLAIAAGIRMPDVAILDSGALNAFACGLSEEDAAVVVTSGILNALDDEELEAVIAHEITHIKNGDIALLAVANTALSSIKWLEKWNFIKFGKKRAILFIFMPILIFFTMFINFVMNVGTTIAKISRLLIASSREYVADAEAVRLTHNPAALISALQKIEGRSTIEGLDEVADAMMIDGAVEGAFATHPTISERIAALSQHAGAMVQGNTTRRDTRGLDGRSFGNRTKTAFFTQPVSAPKAAEKKSLIARVNADRGTNMFGISPTVGKVMKYGMIGMFTLSIIGSWSMQSKMRSIEKELSQSQTGSKEISSISSDIKTSSIKEKKSVTKKPDPAKKKKLGLSGLDLRGTSN